MLLSVITGTYLSLFARLERDSICPLGASSWSARTQDLVHFCSLGGTGLIEDGMAVDLEIGEGAAPAILIEGKGLVAYGEETAEAESIWEGRDAGGEGAIGPGGVVVGNATGRKVGAEEGHELRREQVGNVGAVIEGSVHDDEVEALIGMTDEPTAAIVDDDVDLRIGEQTGYFRMVADERQVAAIDFDKGEVFDTGTVDDDLRP